MWDIMLAPQVVGLIVLMFSGVLVMSLCAWALERFKKRRKE